MVFHGFIVGFMIEFVVGSMVGFSIAFIIGVLTEFIVDLILCFMVGFTDGVIIGLMAVFNVDFILGFIVGFMIQHDGPERQQWLKTQHNWNHAVFGSRHQMQHFNQLKGYNSFIIAHFAHHCAPNKGNWPCDFRSFGLWTIVLLLVL